MDGKDVIAAISTPPGEGGIGIVRISGNDSINLANRFLKLSSNKSLVKVEKNKLCHGYVLDDSKNIVDEVLVSTMRAPHSFTADDTVEINCHGGPIALRKTLELAIKSGARLAEPGEFTKRAFLNGRIDLTQAEAVAEIIAAKSKEALCAAVSQVAGRLSKKINDVRSCLLKALTQLEVAVDFSDDEPEVMSKKEIKTELKQAKLKLDKLAESYMEGRLLKEGVLVVIVGPPNAGKSSILNALIKHERAIVTEMPGTTRDLIEETVNIRGVPLIVRDTAGVRKPMDIAEEVGVNKAKQSVKEADLVLVVLDGSRSSKKDLRKMANLCVGQKSIVVLNKKDLGLKVSDEEVLKETGAEECVETSAKNDEGIDSLEKTINDIIFKKQITAKEAIVTNLRHYELLVKSLENLQKSEDKIEDEPEEITALFLRSSLAALDKITGRNFESDLLDSIFENFCLGK